MLLIRSLSLALTLRIITITLERQSNMMSGYMHNGKKWTKTQAINIVMKNASTPNIDLGDFYFSIYSQSINWFDNDPPPLVVLLLEKLYKCVIRMLLTFADITHSVDLNDMDHWNLLKLCILFFRPFLRKKMCLIHESASLDNTTRS